MKLSDFVSIITVFLKSPFYNLRKVLCETLNSLYLLDNYKSGMNAIGRRLENASAGEVFAVSKVYPT